MIFKGPYESVAAAYPVLMEFIAKNSYTVSGPICETYLDDPASMKPEELPDADWWCLCSRSSLGRILLFHRQTNLIHQGRCDSLCSPIQK